MFYMNPRNQVYGSEAYNALANIKIDQEVSQIYGVYQLESDKKILSESDQKVISKL